MSEKTALVVANGLLPASEILAECAARAEVIICADGGANRAHEAGLQPRFVVGDLDSVSADTRCALVEAQFIYRPSQEATDLEKTLTFAVEQKVQRALLVGITGLRFDHQLVNLNIAEKFCDRLELEAHDNFGVGSFIRSEGRPATVRFASFPGQQISLIAFRRVRGIVTEGLRYPLKNEDLEWSKRDGLSNEALADAFAVTVTEGNLFCYRVRREVTLSA
ncbi:MAG: thiamine diphosphokinase [bacterium]